MLWHWCGEVKICNKSGDGGATCLARGIAGASCEAASSKAYDKGCEKGCEEGSRFPLVGKRRTEAHYVKHNESREKQEEETVLNFQYSGLLRTDMDLWLCRPYGAQHGLCFLHTIYVHLFSFSVSTLSGTL